MRTHLFLLFFSLFFVYSCKKEKVPVEEPEIPVEEPWEKFIGNYKVFDTLGEYLYDAEISHTSFTKPSGVVLDSFVIHNFADTMDLKFKFQLWKPSTFFDIGFSQPTYDKIGNPWHVTTYYDDSLTSLLENNLKNDSMTLYFRMTNLLYYDNISTFYYWCDCKHVYVKQK